MNINMISIISRSTIAITDRLINASDHVKTFVRNVIETYL